MEKQTIESIESIVYKLALRNSEKLVFRGLEIQAGLWDNLKTEVMVEVHKNYLEEAEKAAMTDKYYVHKLLTVMLCDPLRLSDPYLVTLPDGTVKWVPEYKNT